MNPISFFEGACGTDGIFAGNLGREALAAALTLLVFMVTAPAGRRWLARGAALLLAISPAALLIAPLFPADADGERVSVLVMRLLLLASLFQSLLLVVVVSVWERIRPPMPQIFLDVLRWFTAVAALTTILGEAGVAANTLVTSSAVVTAALGFALRDTLGNVFAGLAIHAEHPFEPGDWIQYDENPAHIGRVVEINWRATKVITLDEAYVIIPNGQLGLASIRNFTKPDPWSRRSVFVTTPYDVSPQQVQGIILEALRGSFGVLEEPPASVVTNAFTERGVEHWVRFFTTEFDKRDRVDGMARDRIWFALARHGIEIPVATRQVRVSRQPTPASESLEAVLDRREAVLGGVGLLQVLDAPQRRQLAEGVVEQTFAAAEPVIRQGDQGTSMYVIESGRVAVSVQEAGGEPVRVADLGPGDFFGEMSLLTGARRSATVTAVVESRLLVVGKECLRPCLEANPELAATLGEFLAIREQERLRAIAGGPAAAVQASPRDLLRLIKDFFSL